MDRVGTTSDGRIALDLRGAVLAPPLVAELEAAIAARGRAAAARVFIVDAPLLAEWTRMDAAGLADLTGLLYRLGSRAASIDELLVAHASREPVPAIDPALLWVLRSAGLRVRPFAIG